jgi:predicted dehydrogenase
MNKITLPARIGLAGCGAVSHQYLPNLLRLPGLKVVAVSDVDPTAAAKVSEQYDIPAISVDDLLADPEIDIVINLTPIRFHVAVTRSILDAGKHVYSEKSLATTIGEAQDLLALAESKGLVIAGAPDTFLGAGVQGCRKLLAEDVIGEPIGVAAHMICHGHETWHPDPEFYYRAPGGGPMLDMGPYYVTALCQIMGPVKSVMGMTRITYPTRTITSQPLSGTVIDVGVPTHQTAMLRFESGAVATLITTFDVFSMPGVNCIEIYGERGNMIVPDPNNFGGEIKIKVKEKNSPDAAENFGGGDWILFDTPYDVYSGNERGVGLADMAAALKAGRTPRASAALQTLHVLEVLTAIERSSCEGREIAIESPFEAQKMLPVTAEENVF